MGKNNFLIGCDPEFEIYDTLSQRVLNGRDVSFNMEGVGRCDGSNAPEVGLDGAGAQLELRPKPGKDARRIMIHLRRLMKKAKSALPPFYTAIVNGDHFPLGFHVHIGKPPEGDNPRPFSAIIEAFDSMLYRPIREIQGGARGSYAMSFAVRAQNWGWEYKSLPAVIMAKPSFCYEYLKAVESIVRDFSETQGQNLPKNKRVITEQDTIRSYVGEYRKLGIESLYHAQRDLIKHVRESSILDVFDTWGISRPEKCLCKIDFVDTWQEQSKVIIKMTLASLPLRILMYGLSDARGKYAVTGIPRMAINYAGLVPCNANTHEIGKAAALSKVGKQETDYDLVVGVCYYARRSGSSFATGFATRLANALTALMSEKAMFEAIFKGVM